jgi:hypothetical protein
MSRLRNGTCRDLEDEADRILKDSFIGKSRADRGDVLTPGMMEARQRREVLVSTGAPDGRLRQGLFHRAWNSQHPHLNSSDGAARLRRGAAAGVFAESSAGEGE